MALVKFGGGVSEMRGKEAGIIYSRNAYGSYVKQKVSPVNPQTTEQLNQRTLMGNLAQTWAGLTSGDKATWDNLGSQVTRVNRFGDTTYYTGFSLFMKLNRNAVLAGGTANDTAPVIPEIPVCSFTSMTADVSDTLITVNFSPTVPTGYKMFFYATPNILTGRRFVKNYYRLVAEVAAAQTTPYAAYGAWTTYFGTVPVAGAMIFAKIKLVHVATGFEGVPSTANCEVTA